MRKYELTVVLDKKATEAKKKAFEEKITKIVETLKGKVGKSEDWGEKEIGVYLHFPLELDGASAKALLPKLNSEELERFMLVKKD